jgi:hypothetical protein
MIKNQRSFVSKNSNSLNDMIKKTSMTIKQNDYANIKKLLAISLAAIMVFGSFSLGSLTADNSAFGAKGGGHKTKEVIEWSNGAPSGAHHNLIIHGKKLTYDCDETPGGGSVFVPTYTSLASETQTIEFVSNQKSKIENLTATDPCSEEFSNDNSGAQVQIPYESSGYYVYWSLKGKPQNGKDSTNNVSNFTLAGPNITQFCNVTEASSIVQEGDSDVGSLLMNFTNNIRHEDTGSNVNQFDIGETVYLDNEPNQIASDGDTRLANAGNWTDPNTLLPFVDGSVVDGDGLLLDDPDKDETLAAFVNGTEMYRDTDLSGDYTIGEPIYDDSTGSIPNEVDAGDTRLFVKDGSEALSCDDEDLINGAGAITDKEAFKLKNGSLERFDDSPPQKGKGKNNFVDITGLFQWSGAICNATILDDPINTNDDGQITIEDFDIFNVDGELDWEDVSAALGVDETTAKGYIDAAEDDAINIGNQDQPNPDPNSDDNLINTDKEFAAFMEVVYGEPPYECTAIYDEWVFNLAQIVGVGVDVINDGGITVQVRFYPVDTTVIE